MPPPSTLLNTEIDDAMIVLAKSFLYHQTLVETDGNLS